MARLPDADPSLKQNFQRVYANSPKGADKGWLGDAWMVMIFILAPLCVLGAGITGIMGAAKRKGCFAIGIALVPVLVVVAMVLFLWLALAAVSSFR